MTIRLTLLVLVASLAGCKQRAQPSPEDSGAGSGATSVDASLGSPVKDPPVSRKGPRPARPNQIHRIRNLKSLRAKRTFAGVGRWIEHAVRDVYASASFAKQVEKVTGEPLREPQAIVLERLSIGKSPAQLWRVTYEAWCGRRIGGSAGYKSDHLLLSSVGKTWRLVTSYRPGCDESGEPEVSILDLDGDGGEDLLVTYASTRLGAENKLVLQRLQRTSKGFGPQRVLREGSPFQTMEVRYLPTRGGARDIHFRTFREEKVGCAFFEMTVVYSFERAKGLYVRGRENLRPVPAKTLIDEGEYIDPRCEPKRK